MNTIKTWQERIKPEYHSVDSFAIAGRDAEITELRERVAYLESYTESQKDAMRVIMDKLATVREALKAQEPVAVVQMERPMALHVLAGKTIRDGMNLYAAPVAPVQPLTKEQVQPAQGERTVSIDVLSKMFHAMAGIDKNQEGYVWRKGWNAALRQAMDYAQPAALPQSNAERVPLTDEQIEKVACPFIQSVGSYEHWNAIPDNGAIEEFARAIEAETTKGQQ